MSQFEKVHFKGSFRDYQMRVLNNADQYLKDGKINIVAAPGSGKTVLGLELIRRLDAPCIVFSPTTAIRQQWGERFKDLFLDDPEDYDTLFSNDLHNVKLVNSVTYQALYSAIEKIPADDEGEIDCSDVALFDIMNSYNIKTVCLDESHHLKNEWQRALEKFITALDRNVKIISLTATPPYDSEGPEWSRYISICGEIDEEIFVPELVGQNTLCPHQDYIYFNYPDKTEIASFQDHKQRATQAIEALGKLSLFRSVSQIMNTERDYEKLFSSAKLYIALLTLLRHYHFEIDNTLVKELTAKRGLPIFKPCYAETAIQFLLDGELITPEEKTEIIAVLKSYSVYEKKKVTLEINEKLKRTLISSVGKLESIRRIVKSEIGVMGDSLRMLILTDYIKKENLSKIATEEAFSSVNIVSIFETLRRDNPGVKIGVLSGTLVILPQSVDLSDIKHKKEDIPHTDYCVVSFSGSLHRAVAYVGRLLESGHINILVGTRSLLGEGWDSPCINSLILASFVGSFVLSNQMRGRAIRIDKTNPDKTANIWHLVTVEPEYLFPDKIFESILAYMQQDNTQIYSYDFEVLKRRFDSFMGPNYSTGVIESGIERITAIKPPFDQAGIDRINQEMLTLSANRAEMKDKWCCEVAEEFAVVAETDIPKDKRVPVFTFWNFGLALILAALEMSCMGGLISAVSCYNLIGLIICAVIMVPLSLLLIYSAKKFLLHCNPANSIRTLGTAVYRTLRECGIISSSAKVCVETNKGLEYVSMHLRNASIHDQNIFNTAMAEMLSPIENPRYILIGKNMLKQYNYERSFACPSVIGKKKEYVEILAQHLQYSVGKFEPVYTHREDGRRLILKCRKYSYITFNEKMVNRKFKVSHWS